MAYVTFSPCNGRWSVRELVQWISSSRSLSQLTTPLTLAGTWQGVAVGEDQTKETNQGILLFTTVRLGCSLFAAGVANSVPLRVEHHLQAYYWCSVSAQSRSLNAPYVVLFASVEEELGGRFPFMFNRRQMPSASGDETPRMVLRESVVAMPSQQERGCQVSTRYTPYSYQPYRGASRMSHHLSVLALKVQKCSCEMCSDWRSKSKVTRGPFRQDFYDHFE